MRTSREKGAEKSGRTAGDVAGSPTRPNPAAKPDPRGADPAAGPDSRSSDPAAKPDSRSDDPAAGPDSRGAGPAAGPTPAQAAAAHASGHPWLRAIVALAAFVALDVLLCWVFEPYATVTDLAWHDYRQAQAIDTIVVGSSYAQFSINPLVLDDELHSASYNLGTPAQSFDNSLAALTTAIDDHHVSRAILCLEYPSMAPEPWANAAITFTQAKCLGESLPQVASDVGRLVGNPHFFSHHYSLTCAFPWAYNYVELTPQEAMQNVRRRLSGSIYEAAANYDATVESGHLAYQGQGFSANVTDMPFRCVRGTEYAKYAGVAFNEDSVRNLRRICQLCASSGVRLYVVAPPMPASQLLEYGTVYGAGMTELARLIEGEGATFMDLNMLHRDVLDLSPASFFDEEHLSLKGANATTAVLARLVRRIEDGQDVSGDFYSYGEKDWDALVHDVDYVDSVDFSYERTGDDVRIDAIARTGFPELLEFEFQVRDPQTGEYRIVQPYGPASSCTMKAGDGTLDLRVLARVQPGENRFIDAAIVV